MHVVVGIPTCNRKDGLERLLKGIQQLRFEDERLILSVLVVENGNQCGAEETVQRYSGLTDGIRVLYTHEPRPGIPFARNALLDGAMRLRADFLAFIDDDEVPRREWLSEGLKTMTDFKADVVAGPVLPDYAAIPPKWLTDTNFFLRRRLPTGTLLSDVSAGNVFVRMATVQRLGHRFVEEHPFSGGEDTIFFRLLAASGARMVWCDTAIVEEKVGVERMRVGWMLRRAFRTGANQPQADLTLHGRTKMFQTRWLFGGLARIFVGCFQAVCKGVTSGRSGFLRGGILAARGLGMIFGTLSYQPEEYRKIHDAGSGDGG